MDKIGKNMIICFLAVIVGAAAIISLCLLTNYSPNSLGEYRLTVGNATVGANQSTTINVAVCDWQSLGYLRGRAVRASIESGGVDSVVISKWNGEKYTQIDSAKRDFAGFSGFYLGEGKRLIEAYSLIDGEYKLISKNELDIVAPFIPGE